MALTLPDQETAISGLQAPFQGKVRLLAERIERDGLPLVLFEANRTFARQRDLYAKGRARDAKGVWRIVDEKAVVTKALPGQGAHNWGLAVDWILDVNSPWWGSARPSGPWDRGDARRPLPKVAWEKYGRLVRECGLRWGGDWGWDFPHCELPDWRSLRPKDWVLVVERELAGQVAVSK